MADEMEFNLFPPRGSTFSAESVAGLVGQWTPFGGGKVRVVAAKLNRDGTARVRVAGGGLAAVEGGCAAGVSAASLESA